MNELGNIKSASKIVALSEKNISTLQDALKAIGYSIDDPRGVAGRETAGAWAKWKAKNYLGEPDLIGPASIELLLDQLQKQKESDVKGFEIDWTDFSCKISLYFTVGEVCNFDFRRFPPTPAIRNNAITLARELDILRRDWGKPIIVTSWYRPPSVNREVGGAKNSQHLTGRAADIRSDSIGDFQSWLDRRWDKALGYGAKKGFVHIDLRPGRIRWNY